MDRENLNLELEKNADQSALTSSITSPESTTMATDTQLLSTTDDDTFETWTLLNDKEKGNSLKKLNDTENRIETLKNDDHDGKDVDDEKINVERNQLQKFLNDVTNDDLSDGISIISESESVGRISPTPYMREHLHDINLRFSLNGNSIDEAFLNKLKGETKIQRNSLVIQQQPVNQHIRKRRRSSSSVSVNENQALQKSSQTVATSSGLPSLVKKNLQGIFYLGMGLAILALVGKIINPTWQPLANVVSSTSSTEELEQKVNDIELQNNLMRAEIDLLNKQVKYLTMLNDPQQQQKQKQDKYKHFKERKTFQAWTGNGDSLKPVDITKEDLRKPYKCPDGSFVEIANMCLEQKSPNDPTIVDQFSQVMEDLKEQSETFKTFEKAAEELRGFKENPFEKLHQVLGEDQKQLPNNIHNKNKPIYQPNEDFKQKLPNQKKYEKPATNNEKESSTSYKQYKYDKGQTKYEQPTSEYRKSFGKNQNPENQEFIKYHDKEKSNKNSKEGGEFNYSSKEKKTRKDNSKERFNKHFNGASKENNSKEHYNKQKLKYNKNDAASGEWQENYMKHRENQRKQNEQKYQENKNWYIKRGDSREYKRSGEKQFR